MKCNSAVMPFLLFSALLTGCGSDKKKTIESNDHVKTIDSSQPPSKPPANERRTGEATIPAVIVSTEDSLRPPSTPQADVVSTVEATVANAVPNTVPAAIISTEKRADGYFDVRCSDGTKEIASKAMLDSANVCVGLPSFWHPTEIPPEWIVHTDCSSSVVSMMSCTATFNQNLRLGMVPILEKTPVTLAPQGGNLPAIIPYPKSPFPKMRLAARKAMLATDWTYQRALPSTEEQDARAKGQGLVIKLKAGTVFEFKDHSWLLGTLAEPFFIDKDVVLAAGYPVALNNFASLGIAPYGPTRIVRDAKLPFVAELLGENNRLTFSSKEPVTFSGNSTLKVLSGDVLDSTISFKMHGTKFTLEGGRNIRTDMPMTLKAAESWLVYTSKWNDRALTLPVGTEVKIEKGFIGLVVHDHQSTRKSYYSFWGPPSSGGVLSITLPAPTDVEVNSRVGKLYDLPCDKEALMVYRSIDYFPYKYMAVSGCRLAHPFKDSAKGDFFNVGY